MTAPSPVAMRAAEKIASRRWEMTTETIASLIDAEIAPLADAERVALVREINQAIGGYYWVALFKRCADALSRPSPGWDEACSAIVRDAIEGALKVGAPGLHDTMRNAVMLKAMTQIRFMLRQHAQEDAAIVRGMKGQGNDEAAAKLAAGQAVPPISMAIIANDALEAAAQLFEPGCSCPHPCDDYWTWPSPCAKKAADQIRALKREPIDRAEGVTCYPVTPQTPSQPPNLSFGQAVKREPAHVVLSGEAARKALTEEGPNVMVNLDGSCSPIPPATADVADLLDRLGLTNGQDDCTCNVAANSSNPGEHDEHCAFPMTHQAAATIRALVAEREDIAADARRWQELAEETGAVRDLMRAERDAAWDRLPDGMKECTVLFKECEKGHGRLVGTNWVDHGCHWCERDALRAERDAARDALNTVKDKTYSGINDFDNFTSYRLECIQDVALRALSAAPASPPPALPSEEEIARAICPWAFDPDCGDIASVCEAHRKDAMQKAKRVLALIGGKA